MVVKVNCDGVCVKNEVLRDFLVRWSKEPESLIFKICKGVLCKEVRIWCFWVGLFKDFGKALFG